MHGSEGSGKCRRRRATRLCFPFGAETVTQLQLHLEAFPNLFLYKTEKWAHLKDIGALKSSGLTLLQSDCDVPSFVPCQWV